MPVDAIKMFESITYYRILFDLIYSPLYEYFSYSRFAFAFPQNAVLFDDSVVCIVKNMQFFKRYPYSHGTMASCVELHFYKITMLFSNQKIHVF